jgi:hypothetical protein
MAWTNTLAYCRIHKLRIRNVLHYMPLALLKNIRLGRKGLSRTNGLAYLATASEFEEQGLITLTSVASTSMKFVMNVCNEDCNICICMKLL